MFCIIYIILTISMMLMISFFYLNHPLSLGLILLIQTILMAIFMGLMNSMFWYSYIFFIILISSLLILFIYMTSLISNYQFQINKKMIFTIITFFMFFLFNWKFLNSYFIFNEYINFNFIYFHNMNIFELINKLYSINKIFIMTFIINYLFYTMIIINKIMNIKQGPMKMKF
uniref:NADH dehydrogenase subunit 6 n=1 Tax=Mengenilla moldrzyki TaxID=1155016 RepID=J3RYF7_MENMO|nr:NADH dehydrogenase subunit 6 [Mengenilla moldrzyki]AFC35469.1 NADH dehydrogenase subunit 6 [Mengenilla moldrzyki]